MASDRSIVRRMLRQWSSSGEHVTSTPPTRLWKVLAFLDIKAAGDFADLL